MRYYDFQKAKSFIEENKERITTASLGMDEDWFWTAETVFEDGGFVINLENDTKIGGIDGSYWATPTLEVVYTDGHIEKYNCFRGEKDADCRTPFLQGVISMQVSAERAAVLRKEIECG